MKKPKVGLKPLAVWIPPDVMERFRAFCDADGRKMGTVAVMAIEAWMGKSGDNAGDSKSDEAATR